MVYMYCFAMLKSTVFFLRRTLYMAIAIFSFAFCVRMYYLISALLILFILFRALSALAHWAPVFGETSYLPELVFPFVKLFQNNQLATFEILATVLSKRDI